MRSLLVQASSVEKAVEKGWSNAGMPTEFSVKILEFGKKGFLGMTKKPAIISIMYEPKKQTAISRVPQNTKPAQQHHKKEHPQEDRPAATSNATNKNNQPTTRRHIQKATKIEPTATAATTTPIPERCFWTDALIYDVTSSLTDLSKLINIHSSFKVKTQKKILTITFDREVLATQEEERLLFSGLSYLLIQFLKKKHKKKYQGYKLVLAAKRTQ